MKFRVQPLPDAQGTPFQPAASSLKEVALTHDYDALLPARQLWDGERAGLPCIKQEYADPSRWPLGTGDAAKRHVLVVGRSLEQARSAAAGAFTMQPELRSMGALVLVPPTAAAATPEGALQSVGTSKDAMNVQGLKCAAQDIT